MGLWGLVRTCISGMLRGEPDKKGFCVYFHPNDAESHGVVDGEERELIVDNQVVHVTLRISQVMVREKVIVANRNLTDYDGPYEPSL